MNRYMEEALKLCSIGADDLETVSLNEMDPADAAAVKRCYVLLREGIRQALDAERTRMASNFVVVQDAIAQFSEGIELDQ